MRPLFNAASWTAHSAFRGLSCGALALAISSASLGPASAESRKLEIGVRLVAQEGLAVALASTVLQTQLYVLINAIDFDKGCTDLGEGGSVKPISRSKDGDISVSFYFDAKCRAVFAEAAMHQELRGTKKNGKYLLTGDVTYHDREGAVVAVIKIDERAVFEKGALTAVTGLGDFTPSNGGLKARLGLACALPKDFARPFTCSGGVAQAFDSVGLSLGSVSPLKLRLQDDGSVTFKGDSSVFATAAGTLKIVQKGDTELALSQPSDAVGSSEAEGSAASFSLFPPTPTGWTVTNPANGLKFSLDVVSNQKRNSIATITNKSGKQLAIIKVDQSGTGWISYFGGPRLPVVSWVLGG